MNGKLEAYARSLLKASLARCNEKQQDKFMQMYSPNNLDLPINEVVNNMPADKLDWAMQQVENTLNK